MPRPRTSDVRKAIPDRVKVMVLLRMLGMEPTDVEWDHDPALALRPFSTVTGDFIPPQLDPNGIVARSRADHRTKTSGRKGERKVTSYGSDAHAIAKTRRLSRVTAEASRRLLAKTTGEPAPEPRRKRAWPKGRKLQSRNDLRRRT